MRFKFKILNNTPENVYEIQVCCGPFGRYTKEEVAYNTCDWILIVSVAMGCYGMGYVTAPTLSAVSLSQSLVTIGDLVYGGLLSVPCKRNHFGSRYKPQSLAIMKKLL